MPKFKVHAKDVSGNKVEQVVEAIDANDARSQFRSRNLTIERITEEKGGGKKAGGAKQQGGAIEYKFFALNAPPKPKIKSKDLVVFTRQFATMIGAGIPVLECLDILTEQAEDPGFKLIMTRVVEDVRAGKDFSSALGCHPIVFPDIYVNMIRAGEASGQLDEILMRLAEYQESSEKLKGQIKSAMTYPVVSILLVVGITAALLLLVIPKFKAIFEGLVPGGAEALPMPTKVVLAMSDALMNNIWAIVGIIVIIFFTIRTVLKTPKGAYAWDYLKLKLPIVGPLSRKISVSRFARTFSTLIRSGVNILGALEIVGATAGNKVLEKAVNSSRDAIRAGEPLAKPLGESPVFPPMVVRMVAIGERSGALETLLEKISQFYDDEVSAMVEGLTALIEPLMIGVMGLLVGGIVLAVFLPILKIQGATSKT